MMLLLQVGENKKYGTSGSRYLEGTLYGFVAALHK